jgi:putative hydrolase of the HAD superfamily
MPISLQLSYILYSNKHIFFDLDRTLWDFDRNSEAALRQIITEENLIPQVESFERFHKAYERQNAHLWKLYGRGKIKKDELRYERFRSTFQKFKIRDESLVRRVGDAYVQISPRQTGLFPNAIETLKELKSMGFTLHIITNGFQEVQFIKLENCGMHSFFDVIVCSEFIGKNKPDPAIFHYAMKEAGTKAADSLMIGDDYRIDVAGALQVGMHAIHFDPIGKNKYNYDWMISDLAHLPEMVIRLMR